MKLAQYMIEHSLSDEDMASRIGGVSVSGVRKWRRDERLPRVEEMRRIFQETGGMVTPNDFVLQPAEQVSP